MEKEIFVLIIDDEPVARESLESALINQGYNLVFAHNGPEGLVKALDIMPDVVLLDIMMPGMNGFEVCQKLRQEPLLSEVPIILITALDDKKSRLQGLEAGADDFISKPFDRIELRTRLRSITRLNRYRNLLNERSKTSWIIDQAKDGYLLIDQNKDITYSNKSASKYFGVLDPERLRGKNFLEMAKEHYNLLPETAWQDWPITKVKPYLIKPETENNRAIFLQVSAFASARSFQLDWLVNIRDVTESTKLQNEVWKFHSVISHKLRNPLTVTLGSLELLAQELYDQESAFELLNMAIVNTKKLSENVKSVLSFVTTRNLAQEGTCFSLANFPEMLKEMAQNLEIEFLDYFEEENLENIKLQLSYQAFTIIVKELLENSKKFHPKKSPKIEIRASKDNNKVTITFSDDGKNLTPNQLTQVWMPYYQAEKHLTGQIFGMGLGLPTIATLIWGVGGICYAQNRTDKNGLIIMLIIPTLREEF